MSRASKWTSRREASSGCEHPQVSRTKSLFLLDTNVVSEVRKPRPHGAVVAWLGQIPNEQLYLSAVTLGELQGGVELTRQRDPAKAVEIEAWIDHVPEMYRVLAMDTAIFRLWARLMHGQPNQLANDGMIAATAIVNNLVVATRNVRDFAMFPVPILNPFETPR